MRKLTLGACKIDRAIQDILPMKTRGNDFLVYSALMMNVNATEHVNNDGIKIFPGQIQTSIKAIAEETGFTDKAHGFARTDRYIDAVHGGHDAFRREELGLQSSDL